jgi:hypothetical protein
MPEPATVEPAARAQRVSPARAATTDQAATVAKPVRSKAELPDPEDREHRAARAEELAQPVRAPEVALGSAEAAVPAVPAESTRAAAAEMTKAVAVAFPEAPGDSVARQTLSPPSSLSRSRSGVEG